MEKEPIKEVYVGLKVMNERFTVVSVYKNRCSIKMNNESGRNSNFMQKLQFRFDGIGYKRQGQYLTK